MKILIALLMMVSSSLFADTADVRTLLLDGSRTYEAVNLSTEKTRTEYRTVRVPSTCYRTEYRTICRNEGRQCRRICDRRGNCRNQCTPGRRVCRQEPRQVRYTCMRNETRAYEVFDYNVETAVRFEIDNSEVQDYAREEVTVKAIGDKTSLVVRGSSNYFVYLESQNRTETRRSQTKFINLDYRIKLIPAYVANNVLKNGYQNVKLRGTILHFSLGAGYNLEDFVQRIRIFRNRRLGTDPLLLNRALSPSEVTITERQNRTDVTIDLANLGIQLPSKMRVILDVNYNLDTNRVLNRNQIKTSASTNWVFR